MTENECFKIGTVSKIDKRSNEIVVILSENYLEKFHLSEPIFVKMNASDQMLVPFFIDFFAFDNNKLRVSIKDFPKEDLYLLKDKPVYLLNKYQEFFDKNYDEWDVLINAKVYDKGKFVGTITQLIDVKNNPLIEIKAKNNTHLIPLNEDFIIDYNSEEKSLTLDLPEGLLDL